MTAPRLLFFGRHDCAYSARARQHMEELGFDVEAVISKHRGESLADYVNGWQGEYIICFRSFFILPRWLIDRASIASVNFHPGPPEYPGSGCLNFALYDNAERYGVTCHIMDELVDHGPIVEARYFPIRPDDGIESLLARSHESCFELLIDTLRGVASSGGAYLQQQMHGSRHLSWAGPAIRLTDLHRLQEIEPDCSAGELERRIRAAHHPHFPLRIKLHGYEFLLDHPKNEDESG